MWEASIAVVLVIAGICHLLTGHSVFRFAARVCIVLDAVLVCGWRVLQHAVRVWWRRMPSAISEVKTDVVRPLLLNSKVPRLPVDSVAEWFQKSSNRS